MDITNIIHLNKGNIIEITAKPLFVEEACSGVDSQYALMAVAGVLLLIGNTGVIVSMITIITVPIWAILGNLLRIYSIVLGLSWFGIDLSEGTSHTILGLVVFLIAAWAHWSSVQFLNFLESRFFSSSKESKAAFDVTKTTSQKSDDVSVETVKLNEFPIYALTLPLLLVLFAPLGIKAIVSFHYQDLPSLTETMINKFPGKRDMPDVLLGQRRVDFHTATRSRKDLLGQYSRTWGYSGSLGSQVASLDLPFRGWHPLWECYGNSGWKIIKSKELESSKDVTSVSFPYFETLLQNDLGDSAILHFSLFDENGECYKNYGTFERRTEETRLTQWLTSVPLSQTREPITFQFQVVSNLSELPSEESLQKYRNFYLLLREKAYQRSMPVVEEIRSF